MKKLLYLAFACCTLYACKNGAINNTGSGTTGGGKELSQLFDHYWQERMQLFPMEATAAGDYRYNDKMTITIAESFRDTLKTFYSKYLGELQKTDSTKLDQNDLLSYRLLKYEMQMGLEGLKYPDHLMPINQFWAFTLDLPQLGSGSGNQPFKTVKDYDDFLKRLSVFPAWTDTAIANMRKGIATGWVLPRALVVKIMPQLKDMVAKNANESIFYAPVKTLPDSFGANKQRLAAEYTHAIDSIVIPCYSKLYTFFEKEYLPKARSTSGVGSLPNGKAYYQYCIKVGTTTDFSPDSIYNLGMSEVARIEKEMNDIKTKTGYIGDMKSFFAYLDKDPKLCPFATPQQVIDSFWNIKKLEDPQLKKLFNHVPKSPFTIRQTEAFRAASGSAEYHQPSEDGSRPGIFYVPILDAKKYNAVGMTTLFLHEAIPGHHYQISIQQENKNLPVFRRFLGYNAYCEGWALYSESLGNELGVYADPYQYFGHLSDEIHRAIRLVVDIGLHDKGMSREDAIKYMTAHELISERDATAEIERYMAIPGQALGYKIGQLTIRAERSKCEQALGSKFNIAAFHDELLKDGGFPLNILNEKMDEWVKKQTK